MSTTAVPVYCSECGRDTGGTYYTLGGIILCGLCYHREMKGNTQIIHQYPQRFLMPFTDKSALLRAAKKRT